MLNALAGTAAGMVGGMINDKIQEVMDPDNKKGVDWDALLEPVQQEMIDKYPGHELLAIPDHNSLVLHQKIEATEVLSGLVAQLTDFDVSVETPNTYAIRTRDEGTTFYIIKEDADVAAACCRDQCRTNMPYKFYVRSLRTGTEIAIMESPWACEDCCCGVWCVPCCIPVCCCMRQGEWIMTPESGEEEVLATMRKVPLFGCGTHNGMCNCCDRQIDIEIPATGRVFSMYKKAFCCCDCSEMHFVDETHPYDRPLGKLWPKMWTSGYKPTTKRYPPLPDKSTAGKVMDFVKEVGKDLIGSDADTYLVELPFDDIGSKAGAFLGVLMYDMIYNETNGAQDMTSPDEPAPDEFGAPEEAAIEETPVEQASDPCSVEEA